MTSPAQSNGGTRTNSALRIVLYTLAAALLVAAFRALFEFDPTMPRPDDAASGDRAFFSPTGNAPFFVYAIAAWLFYERRHSFFAALGTPAHLPIAVGSMLGAGGFVGWATYTDSPDLLLPGLSLGWIGLAALAGGKSAARACWLPAASLLALVPVPSIWIHHLVYPLQLATAQISVGSLQLVGIEATRLADRMIVNNRQVFQVIESCSGLRATQTIALSALLYGQIFRRRRLHWLILLLLSPLLGFVINQLRVLSLIFNPYSSFAVVHSAQGLAMLVLGILSIALLDRLLLRILRPSASPSPSTRRVARERAPRVEASRLAIGAACCALLLAASLVPRSQASQAQLLWEPADVPIHIDGWKSQPLSVDRVFLGSSQFTEDTYRSFSRNGDEIRLYLGMMNRAARPGAAQTPKTIPLATQRPSQRFTDFVDPNPTRAATAFAVATEQGPERVLRWHVGVCSIACEGVRSLFALDRSAFQRDGVGYVIRLSTLLRAEADAGQVAEADARLLEFADSLEAAIAATRERLVRRTRADQSKKRPPADAARKQPR